jgi:antitoxin component YwqK of YwqJK toxin-antitoxin module
VRVEKMWSDKVKRLLKKTFVEEEGMFDYHANGTKRREIIWINKNKRIHIEIWRNDQGQKEIEINFFGSMKHGLYTEWYKNGNKKKEVHYGLGEKNGYYITWYDSGRKEMEAYYKVFVQSGMMVGGKKRKSFIKMA